MATPKKLKIGLVLDTSLDPDDGVQQYVMGVGEWLRSHGHNVHYLVGETKKRQLPNIHSLARNITVNFNGNRTTIPLAVHKPKLKELIQKEQFDVLHVQSPHHPLMAQRIILATKSQTAIIATFHVLPYGRFSRVGNSLLGLWLKPSIRRIDQMLAVSEAAAKFERRSFGLDADISPCVINYKRFHEARAFKKYQDGRPTILFFGRLVHRKGCMLLLEAAAKLKQKNIFDFKVLICGAGPLEGSLKDYVKSHQLTEVVEFTGFVQEDDKPRYYASADITVFPSTGGESFGIVLLEAMAAGHALVLAGDNPGYRTVLGEQPELLFNPFDSDVLAQKMENFLVNNQSAKRLQAWQRQEVKKYDIDTVGPCLLDIYLNTIAKLRLKRHN